MKWGILSDAGSAEGEVFARVLTDVVGASVDRRADPTWTPGEIDVLAIVELRTRWLEPGAIARLRAHVGDGDRPILGVAGGAVLLSRGGLVAAGIEPVLPVRIRCAWRRVRVETMATPFTATAAPGEVIELPLRGRAIGFAGDERALERDGRIVLRGVAETLGAPSEVLAVRDDTGCVVAMIPQPQYFVHAGLSATAGETVSSGARLLRSVAAWRDDAPRRRPAESSR